MIFQIVFILVLLIMTWLEDSIPYFVSDLLLLSWNCILRSQLLISARSGARGLQPPESDSTVQWCAGSSPWQRLCLIYHRRKCFVGRNYQTCPRRNSESNGKAPAVSAPWHRCQSGSEGEKVLCHFLPVSSL